MGQWLDHTVAQTGVHLGLIQNWDCTGGKPGGKTGLT